MKRSIIFWSQEYCWRGNTLCSKSYAFLYVSNVLVHIFFSIETASQVYVVHYLHGIIDQFSILIHFYFLPLNRTCCYPYFKANTDQNENVICTCACLRLPSNSDSFRLACAQVALSCIEFSNCFNVWNLHTHKPCVERPIPAYTMCTSYIRYMKCNFLYLKLISGRIVLRVYPVPYFCLLHLDLLTFLFNMVYAVVVAVINRQNV